LTSPSCDQSVEWEGSSEGEGLIPDGQHWINRQVPTLSKDMKSYVQQVAFDKKIKMNLDHILTRCDFYREQRFMLCVT